MLKLFYKALKLLIRTETNLTNFFRVTKIEAQSHPNFRWARLKLLALSFICTSMKTSFSNILMNWLQ